MCQHTGVGASSTEGAGSASDAASISQLIAEVAGANERSLKELFDRTSPKLFGICLRILHDKQEAEDALQEVFVSVWRRAGSFDAGRSSPITWLATIARNRSIDRLRASSRLRTMAPSDEALDVIDTSADSFALASLAQDGARLHTCLEKLDPKQNGAIREAFFDGFAYSQLAERAGVPLGTMKSWIRRGLQSLKKCLEA
jgi:RNA polymerase sigma-70 factor (ECF subfamily)